MARSDRRSARQAAAAAPTKKAAPGRAGTATAEAAKAKRVGRVAQVREAYQVARKGDPRIGWLLAGVFLGTLVVVLLIGLLLHALAYFAFLGVLVAFAVTMVVFSRRAQRSAFAQIEGQPGAAAAALNLLRKGWTVTPAVAVRPGSQDLVHRAVGRPGIVLIGEGPVARVAPMMAQERKKVARILPDIPVHEIVAGNDEGQVPLRKLSAQVMRLKPAISTGAVDEVNKRLKAMGSMTLPIPKGPLPRNVRMPRGAR